MWKYCIILAQCSGLLNFHICVRDPKGRCNSDVEISIKTSLKIGCWWIMTHGQINTLRIQLQALSTRWILKTFVGWLAISLVICCEVNFFLSWSKIMEIIDMRQF